MTYSLKLSRHHFRFGTSALPCNVYCFSVENDIRLVDNRFVSSFHCFIERDELTGSVWLHDTRFEFSFLYLIIYWMMFLNTDYYEAHWSDESMLDQNSESCI